MKMRTKEQILAGMDDNIERRKLEVEIDKRDLLESILNELEEVNKIKCLVG